MTGERGAHARPAIPRAPDGDALAGLIGRAQQPLLARIRRMMGPEARQSAESGDILQSVLADAIRDLRAPRDESARDESARDEQLLLLRLTAAARHRIIDEVRRRRERSLERGSARPAPGPTSVASQLSTGETLQRLGEALDTLAPDRRCVVELRSFDGCSWQRIAQELGRSEEAARKLYHRALLDLGQRLGDLGPESAPHLVPGDPALVSAASLPSR